MIGLRSGNLRKWLQGLSVSSSLGAGPKYHFLNLYSLIVRRESQFILISPKIKVTCIL